MPASARPWRLVGGRGGAVVVSRSGVVTGGVLASAAFVRRHGTVPVQRCLPWQANRGLLSQRFNCIIIGIDAH